MVSNTYSDGGDPQAGLGEDWALETISLRLSPAASSIQSVVTAMLALIERHDLRHADVQRM